MSAQCSAGSPRTLLLPSGTRRLVGGCNFDVGVNFAENRLWGKSHEACSQMRAHHPDSGFAPTARSHRFRPFARGFSRPSMNWVAKPPFAHARNPLSEWCAHHRDTPSPIFPHTPFAHVRIRTIRPPGHILHEFHHLITEDGNLATSCLTEFPRASSWHPATMFTLMRFGMCACSHRYPVNACARGHIREIKTCICLCSSLATPVACGWCVCATAVSQVSA